MVIKKQVPHHFKILRELDLKPYKVTIEWIVQSMFQNQPVLEEEFAYCEEIIEGNFQFHGKINNFFLHEIKNNNNFFL